MKQKKDKTKKEVFDYLINFFLIGLIVFSIIKIINWGADNNKNKKIKKEIDEIVNVDKDKKIDFDKLKKINPDIVGWIKVENTNIDYPIVKTDNNDFYLNHSFDKKYNKAGWIFMNYENRLDGSDKNISIFGHNRVDGSMFGSLKKTLNRKWQQDSNNHLINFITENEETKYKVFSTYKIQVEDYYLTNDFVDDNEYLKFLNELKGRSNHNYNVELNNNDTILTLSTCGITDNERIVLHAKKIS